MRRIITPKNKKQWKQGDTRIIRVFLFIPTVINNDWRWLEIAYIKQELQTQWINLKWVDPVNCDAAAW